MTNDKKIDVTEIVSQRARDGMPGIACSPWKKACLYVARCRII